MNSGAVRAGSLAAPARPVVALDAAVQRIARAAVVALYDELALYPKPGLVSFVDSGSHGDMNGATFLRSLFTLRHFFLQITRLGAGQAPFERLEHAGRVAEQRMLLATGGVNTHRGAIFSLGLLCAGAGALAAQRQPLAPGALRAVLLARWGGSLRRRCQRVQATHGQLAARRYGLRSAGEEAALGFPVLFEVAVPALQAALQQMPDAAHARLHTLLHIMATLDDTNLAHRGGRAGLRFAQAAAQEVLRSGDLARAHDLHRVFMARRLSPGGAADVLAAACWVQRVCSAAPGPA